MSELKLHPSVEDLTAFSVGQLPFTEAAELERHIEKCQRCCDTLPRKGSCLVSHMIPMIALNPK